MALKDPAVREREKEPGFFRAAFAELPASLKVTKESEVVRLPGDASNRRFYRAGGEGDRSLILMVLADPDPHRQPAEEFTGGEESPDQIPFLNIHQYLEKIGMPVPQVLHYDRGRGLIYLEDLGDTLLFDLAQSRRHSGGIEFYYQAIDWLLKLQDEAERHPDPACLAFRRRFDVSLFEWELRHFREEILPGKIEGESKLGEAFQRISRELAQEPKCFCHRDYHSRNLMVKEGKIRIIDFQDALLAPRQYDLASLLFDAYVHLDPEVTENLLDHYRQSWDKAGGKRMEAGIFRRHFDLSCIQRGLKAAGRFAYINRVKSNPGFLRFIPGVIGRVEEILNKYPEFAAVKRVLKKSVPDEYR